MSKLTKGDIGELIVSNFFDSNFSKLFSFTSPKTKEKAEVSDVLIWLNRTIFLIEVKTRDTDKATASIESWCHSKIKEASIQIRKNIKRIKAKEKIYLNNKYYHSILDCDGICKVIGLIVLVHEEKCNASPTKYCNDIYTGEDPIHVISWNDLHKMTEEIQTVPDLLYYLNDRFEYLKLSDIGLGIELDVIGYYKKHDNKFPKTPTDFSTCYEKYKNDMESKIKERNKHNENAIWIEKIENLFINQRKLMIDIPIGLLFSWEFGMLSLRERAYYGEKINSVQKWFIDGNTERYFSYQSVNTKNWLLFYFTQLDEKPARQKLEQLTRLKLIKEIEDNSFEFGIYSICFIVSKVCPNQLKGVTDGIIMGRDAVAEKYSKEDVIAAHKKFGSGKPTKIEEFPR